MHLHASHPIRCSTCTQASSRPRTPPAAAAAAPPFSVAHLAEKVEELNQVSQDGRHPLQLDGWRLMPLAAVAPMVHVFVHVPVTAGTCFRQCRIMIDRS